MASFVFVNTRFFSLLQGVEGQKMPKRTDSCL